MVAEIPLSNGGVALVDDEDYAAIAAHRWYRANGYVVRNVIIDGVARTITLHQFLLRRKETDHWDRNKLNNQRGNLRPCTRLQNCRNAGLRKDNRSGYKGVFWSERAKRWLVRIKTEDRLIQVGSFTDPKKAARAYNAAAIELFGEFAWLNPID